MRKKLSVLIICLLFFSVQVFAQLHFPPRFLKIPEILLKERTTAPSASSHYGTFYVKAADGLPYFKTSAGVEHGLAMAVSVGDYLDLPEISEPGTPDATELRLWVQDFHGFSLYSYKDDGGMVRRVGDNVYIGVNNTGSTIPANSGVYSAGNDLDPLPAAVELALAKSDSAATMPCIGVAIESIAAGAYGRYMTVGMIENVNTSTFSVGDTIYVSKDTAGAFTATKPAGPNIAQEMGTIIVDDATLGAALIVARTATTGNIIGTDVQAWDADLDTYATITPSADVQSVLDDDTLAAMRTTLGVPVIAHTMASHSDEDTYDISTSGDIHHGGFISTPYYSCGNSGASITIDWNNGNLQYVTLDNVGVDITFTEPPNPGTCKLYIIQDGTGNRTIDWEHEISPEWPGDVEPTLSTAAAAGDLVTFDFIGGTTYRGLFNGDFK